MINRGDSYGDFVPVKIFFIFGKEFSSSGNFHKNFFLNIIIIIWSLTFGHVNWSLAGVFKNIYNWHTRNLNEFGGKRKVVCIWKKVWRKIEKKNIFEALIKFKKNFKKVKNVWRFKLWKFLKILAFLKWISTFNQFFCHLLFNVDSTTWLIFLSSH